MIRLARTLFYRRTYFGTERTGMRAAGLGVLMRQVNRLTGHASYFWRFADSPAWLRVPVEQLGRLPLCMSRAEVEDVIGVAR